MKQKPKISNKRRVKKWNKELKAYQLRVLGWTTGEAVGDVLKMIGRR